MYRDIFSAKICLFQLINSKNIIYINAYYNLFNLSEFEFFICNLFLIIQFLKFILLIIFNFVLQAGRRFPMDMAGFAVNIEVLLKHPNADIPERVSYIEDGFLRSLGAEVDKLEPLANNCTEVCNLFFVYYQSYEHCDLFCIFYWCELKNYSTLECIY